MLEIIPNWHPIFVHFTVALFSLAVVLFVITPFVKSPLKEQWQIVARWALWFGAAITIVTGLTGLYAYNTVAHDTPSHAAMTEHRNWAIATISLFLTLTIWSIVRTRKQKALGTLFIAGMVIAGGLLASTAWHGGEVVYRYGLGVMSLPKTQGEGHAHEHAPGSEHDQPIATQPGNDIQGQHSSSGGHDSLTNSPDDGLATDAPKESTTSVKPKQNDGHDHEH